MDYKFELVNEKHIDQAVKLVIEQYEEERLAIPFIPKGTEFVGPLKKDITNLFKEGSGLMMLNEGKLIGFICGFEVDGLWGKCKGIYSPLYGHGAIKKNRNNIYQELYRHAANLWVEREITSHAITLFAHDQSTVDTWFRLGFGMRCVDSIKKVEQTHYPRNNIEVKTIKPEDLKDLAHVQSKLHMYFNHSPMFMPSEEEDPIQHMNNWLKEDNRHLFAAYKDGKVIGHMRIQPTGETFLSKHSSIMNVTGAYVLEHERSSGVASQLLDFVQNWLFENKYSLCGVDFESFNIDGNRFWNKHFTAYTNTLTRRIDENILQN